MSLLPDLSNWSSVWPALVEIGLLFLVIYGILCFLQGTRGTGLLRGLIFVVILALLIATVMIEKLHLYRMEYLMGQDRALIFFVLIAVLFQPEVRRLLLRLGETPLLRKLFHGEGAMGTEIVEAVFRLSARKVGGLIVIERETALGTVIEGGTPMDAAVTSDLLVTIFWPGSPLHDGAVVIRNGRVAAAGCLLPLTEQAGLAKTLGTRHRAGIGITEESDALSIIVSEETTQVSVARRGQLRSGLDREQLRQVLEETLAETAAAAPAPAAS